jgi:hypothetical protein
MMLLVVTYDNMIVLEISVSRSHNREYMTYIYAVGLSY